MRYHSYATSRAEGALDSAYPVVGVTKDWAKDSKGSCMVENRAKGNGGWLDWWEVCWIEVSISLK